MRLSVRDTRIEWQLTVREAEEGGPRSSTALTWPERRPGRGGTTTLVDVRRPAPLPAPFDRSPFATGAAHAAGVTTSRIRASDLDAPFVGVRTSAPPTTVLELARAYLPKMAPGEFFSHTTAALIHGMWLPLQNERELVLHVSVRRPLRAPRDDRVRGHHLVDRPHLVWNVDGLPVANPWETWCQLARLLPVPDLVVAGEALLSKGRVGTETMLVRLRRSTEDPLRPYAKRLARAGSLLRIGVRSAAETRFRLFLLDHGLPEPLINVVICDAEGERIAEGDLVYPKSRVLIDYEGDGHRERKQFRKDIHRGERIREEGWCHIRVTEDDAKERPDETVARIRRAIDEGLPPSPEPE